MPKTRSTKSTKTEATNSSSPKAKTRPEPSLKVVRRALEVLEHLSLHPGRAADTAKMLGLRWATLHRTISELEEGGFLQKDPTSNQYSVGQRAWLVGSIYLANHRILNAARPILDEISFDGSISVQLVERAAGHSLVLFTRDIGKEAISKATIGYNFPLHCSSKGQILLAYSDEEFIDDYLQQPLEKLTPYTLTEPDLIRERLAEIRSQGYAKTTADVQLFTGSLSAPIFDANGDFCAAISFVVKKSLLSEKEDSLLETLLYAAQSVSIAIGWKPTFNFA